MFSKIRQLASNALQQVSVALSAPLSPQLDTSADLIEIKVDGLGEAKQHAVWLTKGLDRNQPAKVVRLVDCTSAHLKNILLNKPNLSFDYYRIISSILEDRGEALPVQPIEDDLVDQDLS